MIASTTPEAAATLDALRGSIGPLDRSAMDAARGGLDRLTKPPGSLGRLEDCVVTLAGITGDPRAAIARRSIVVAAADHGVTRQGVSAYPSDVTAQMVANFLAGGAAINVLADAAHATVTVLDVGVAASIPEAAGQAVSERAGRLVRARFRAGTDDMTVGPAMTRDDAWRAIEAGRALVVELVGAGIDLIGIGEMGIGNTTAASAITAVLTGASVPAVTGRGTGIDEPTHRRKVDAIERAIAVNEPDAADPVGVLAAVGGLEIAAIVGVILGAAGARVPVVLDGFITGAGALVAAGLVPAVVARLFASHRSVEPGHAAVLERLGLDPLLDLGLRLGEGSGAALAMLVLDAAVRIRDGMATFDSAAVSGPLEA